MNEIVNPGGTEKEVDEAAKLKQEVEHEELMNKAQEMGVGEWPKKREPSSVPDGRFSKFRQENS